MKAAFVVIALLFVHSALSADPSDGYRPCIIQMYGDEKLRKDRKVPSAAARLSLGMAHELTQRQGMVYHLYDCDGYGHCSKPTAIRDACLVQKCSHVLYIDADVLMHNPRVDVIGHMVKSFPEAALITGVDYYNTIKNPASHNGTRAFWRTDSNAGMILFSCNHKLSYRIMSEWERLCRSYSPNKDDQAALTLMETFPQYSNIGVFVRDALMLGQYSIIARHFPGDGAKKQVYPIASDNDYQEQKKAVSKRSGLFKYVHAYWKLQHDTEIPPTEKWRLDNNTSTGWDWHGPAFKKCPYIKDYYVENTLQGLKLSRHLTSNRSIKLLPTSVLVYNPNVTASVRFLDLFKPERNELHTPGKVVRANLGYSPRKIPFWIEPVERLGTGQGPPQINLETFITDPYL